MTILDQDVLFPQVPSLPRWPEQPEAVDTTAASYLIVAIGAQARVADIADDWVRQARAIAPTEMLSLQSMSANSDRAALRQALRTVRTGVRILMTGGQFDVITALTISREAGAVPAELSSFVVHTDDSPVYCAHCRTTFCAAGGPGDETECRGCARTLEIHGHFASALGSFLASDARVRMI